MLAYFFALKQSILFRDPWIRRAYLIGIIGNLMSWVLMLWGSVVRLAGREIVALHTTVYFGIDLVGPRYRLFYYPLLGLTIIIVNASFVLLWGKRDVFLARSSGFVTALLTISLLAACLYLLLLNL